MVQTARARTVPRFEHAPHVMIVEARFYTEIADELARGAEQVLKDAGASWERHTVPGAFEIPAAIALGRRAGEAALARRAFDGFVALGCVIRGETSHYDHVCEEVASGTQRVQLDTGVPCAFGVITAENMDQALARSGGDKRDQGRSAAIAVLRSAELKAELRA